MWETLCEPWKAAFEKGWEAFCNGSIPIGAAITDENGHIISTGRNRVFENSNLNPQIAHAELESLLHLNLSKYPNAKQYTLYACMEPCPMCFGSIVMGHIRKLKVAARDTYCGAVHFCETDAFIKSKNMQIDFELGELELVQLTLQSYFQIKRSNGIIDPIVQIFSKDSPRAVETAKDFYCDRYLDDCAQNQIEFKHVFNAIVSKS